MQYSASIDDFARLMTTGNNGGYANAWLVADLNRNEIGRLELGLKNVTLERSKDGYFTGANFPVNPKLQAEETTFPTDPGVSATARRARWEQLMAEWKGRIDVEAGKRFMADHYDAYDKKADSPGERTLCGHVELSPRGMKPWQDEFAPAGTVQSKITSTALGKSMTLDGRHGPLLRHPLRRPGSSEGAAALWLARTAAARPARRTLGPLHGEVDAARAPAHPQRASL